MLKGLSGWLSSDIAIDLGTANVLVYIKGSGIIINEPSVVALEKDDSGRRHVRAVGKAAKEMLGRTPANIESIRPMKEGVINDFETISRMLKYFIGRANNRRWGVRPRVVVCIPSGITSVERRAVEEATLAAGASEVFLVKEPLAAAIGANMDISKPSGNMIVDIGGGTTEVAVISMMGIVCAESCRVAGDHLDESIMHYVKKRHNLLIGESTAEQIKMRIGSAILPDEDEVMEVRGRDIMRGIPVTLSMSSREICQAMAEPIRSIIATVRETLEETPPELASDIYETGIVMTGGGAMVKRLDTLIAEETGLPVFIAEDPLNCVVLGCGRLLDDMQLLKQLQQAQSW